MKDPTGIERIKQAVYAADALKQKVVEADQQVATAQAAAAQARAEYQTAEDQLASLVASGACTHENGCSHEVGANGAPTAGGTTFAKPQYSLDDNAVPKVYRIAFWLIANPTLDYAAVAEGIWGPGLDFDIAKNRVGAHLTQLKKLGIVTALGDNKYHVDREALRKHSELPVGEASP